MATVVPETIIAASITPLRIAARDAGRDGASMREINCADVRILKCEPPNAETMWHCNSSAMPAPLSRDDVGVRP
jgi:hypothetical protein